MRFGTAELADLMKALWRDEWQVVSDGSQPSPVFIDRDTGQRTCTA